MRALVVDDSRVMRMLLSRCLAQAGCAEVIQASDGREALAALDQYPDMAVALIDWNMPNLTGIEFVETVRADQRFTGIPLVMVTTESEKQQVERAYAAGVQDYVVKPFTSEVVIAALRRLGL